MTKRDAFLLLLAVGIMIGYTYALDTPQALEIPLRQSPYNFTTAQFNLMYFATFLLIGFMQVPLGIIIDRFPIKRTLIILLLSLLISQAIISIMFDFRPTYYFVVILLMRSIFGLAGEGIFTVQCVVMSIYAESEYELLAGLSLALPFVFDAINSVTTTAVYQVTTNLPLTWYIGTAVCIASLVMGFWLNKAVIGNENEDRIEEIQSKSCFKEMKLLSPRLWVVVFFIFFSQASLGPFNDNFNQLLVSRFGFSYTEAGQLLLITFVGLLFFSVLCGYILRKRPTIRRLSMLISTSLYMVAHFMLFFLDNTDQPKLYHYFGVVFFLITMSFTFAVYYASITTSVPFLISPTILGTAWGCAGSAIGFSQCFVPLLFIFVIGSHSDLGQAYKNLNFLGIVLSIIPVLFAMWINYRDEYNVLDVCYTDCEEVSSRRASMSSGGDQKDDLETRIDEPFIYGENEDQVRTDGP